MTARHGGHGHESADLADKVAFDTGTGELTRLGAQWEMGGKSVTVTPCDAEGRTYTPAGAGKTEPKEPEDGQLFLKSDSNEAYDSNAVLLRYSAKNKKWVEVLLSAVKIRCPGIGGVIREGDTVTISGMPDTVSNAVAKGLNGEVMIQTMDGDEMVAVLTRAEDSNRYYGSWTMTETSVTWKSADGTVTENDAAAAPVKVERRVPGTGLCDGTGKPGVGMQPEGKHHLRLCSGRPDQLVQLSGHCSGQLCRERRQ